jgi:hypothetical protein
MNKTLLRRQFEKTLPNGRVDWLKKMDDKTFNKFAQLCGFWGVMSNKFIRLSLDDALIRKMFMEFMDKMDSEKKFEPYESAQLEDFCTLLLCWQFGNPDNFHITKSNGYRLRFKQLRDTLITIAVNVGSIAALAVVIGVLWLKFSR